MPGWGTGSFENEDAQRWLKQLNLLSLDDLRQIFRAVEPAGYLEAAAAHIVIAAAEVIAAQKGMPSDPLPREIAEWLGRTSETSDDLSAIAYHAVTQVRLNSELKDLWLEADGLNEWSASLRDLEQRLSG